MSADAANEKPTVHTLEESFSSQNKDKVEVDTVHNDEALKIIAEEHGSNEWDPSEEKRLVRKIDWKLLPLLCLTLVWLAGILWSTVWLIIVTDMDCSTTIKPCCHRR